MSSKSFQNASKLNGIVSVLQFGAVGDGTTDDTAAIQAWLAMLSSGYALQAPAGTFKFTQPLVIPAISGISISGAGRQNTKFVYAGASTTADILTIGDGTTSFTGLQLSGFNISSDTTMTAGVALHIKKQQNGGSLISNVSFGANNTTQKLWNGIWFNNTNVTTYNGFEINVQNDAILVNGSVTDTGSDLFLENGTILNANTGVHCGGGFGGLFVGSVLFFGNNTHVKIDNAFVARLNREIVLSEFCIFDTCKDYGLYVNDSLASGSNLSVNAFIGSAGRYGTCGVGNNIHVNAYPNSRIAIGSLQLFNATQNGIWINDASTLLSVGPATQITNNGAFGIYSNVATTKINYQCTFSANTSGDTNGNVRQSNLYTSTVLSSSGTLTTATGSVVWYRTGSRVFFDAYINITTNGTGAGTITCSLPFTIRQAACCIGHTNGLTYNAVFAQLPANQTYLQITNYDGTYPGGTGQTIVVSGVFEAY